MAKKPKIKMQLCIQTDAITGFSYAFCSALLEKLKKLMAENRLFDGQRLKNDPEMPAKYPNMGYIITHLTKMIIRQLIKQMPGLNLQISNMASINEIKTGIADIEEFLAIFQTEPE